MAPSTIPLQPDFAVLMQARLDAGQHNVLMRKLANLMLNDPVLTIEILQTANSAVYGAGQTLDLDGALSRLGSQKIIAELTEIMTREKIEDEDMASIFEDLRYNCRRTSNVALIVTSILRSPLAPLAKLAGLFSDIGNMVALMTLGKKYVDIAKANKRKNIPYRLEKDHNINLEKIRTKFLRMKGLPDRMLLVYDLEMNLKAATDVDLRACVRTAIELVDAYDSEKWDTYSPQKPIPARSDLRLLKVTPVQHERIYTACSEYFKAAAEQLQPSAPSLLVQTSNEDATLDVATGGPEQIKVPNYTSVAIKPSNRQRIQAFMQCCEDAKTEAELKDVSLKALVDSGLFSRAAFIRTTSANDQAIIDASAGFSSDTPKTIPITDANSAFSIFRLDIKSFSSASSATNPPFDTKAFGIGQIAVSADGDRLFFYADSENTPALTVDARGAFRMAMGLLKGKIEILRAV